MSHEMSHTPGEMPELPEFQPPSEGFELAADLTNHQLEDIDILAQEFVRKPSVEHAKQLAAVVEAHIESVRHALEAYSQEFTDGIEAFRQYSFYIFGLEQRRVEMFNQLGLEDVTFSVTNNGNIGETIQLPEDYDPDEASMVDSSEPIDIVHGFYAHRFQQDLISLSESAVDTYADTPRVKYTRYAKIVGRHALDVAKVTAGVVGGIMIVRKYSK